MLLLGGDLFHENKPTRDAEKKCMDLLRKHVLGDSAVEIELVRVSLSFLRSSRKNALPGRHNNIKPALLG